MTEQSDKFINTKLGGCEILEKIGSGGMGSVYKAHHLGLDKIVCIKILSADLAKDERQVQFFLREARSAARLDHPNIVQIHHVGMEHDVHFILMSFIKGETLSGLVARKGSLLITEATNIITGILNGLTAAHSNSIIHRDIKPSNILITDTGVPKIVDFGLARSLKEEKQLTITGELAGTAYFMAPEQGLGGSIDHRADLYATGATYFYILTSKYPFEGKTFMDVVHKHISQPLPSLMKIRSDIPLWTEQVIEKLMRKKPENRFQSAREVLDALSSHEHNGEMQSSSDSVREFDIPLITARLKEISQRSDVAPTAKPARMEPAEKAPPPKPEPAGQAGEVKPSAAASVISWIMSDKYLRFAVHLSITIAAGAIFLLAGSMHGMSGNAGVILLSTCGLGLLLWSFLMRHSRRQTGSTFIDISLSLCSFVLFFLAGVLERGGADAIGRAWIVVTQMRAHFFTRDNTLVYAVIAFIISISIFSGYTRGWRKAAGALLAVVAIALVWNFGHLTVAGYSGNNALLMVGICLTLIGIIFGFTHKIAVFMNSYIFIIAAAVLVYAFAISPHANFLTDKKTRDAVQIQLEAGHLSEYGDDGLPIVATTGDTAVQAGTKKQAWMKSALLPVKRFYVNLSDFGDGKSINATTGDTAVPLASVSRQVWMESALWPVKRFYASAGKEGRLLLLGLLMLIWGNVVFFKN